MNRRKAIERVGIGSYLLLAAILGGKSSDILDWAKMRKFEREVAAAQPEFQKASSELDGLKRRIAKDAGLKFGSTYEIQMHFVQKFGINVDDLVNGRLSDAQKKEMEAEVNSWLKTIQEKSQKYPEYAKVMEQYSNIAPKYFDAIHRKSNETVRQYFNRPTIGRRAMGLALGVGVGAASIGAYDAIRKRKKSQRMHGPRMRRGRR